MNISNDITRIFDIVSENNGQAFLVGGAVRDQILGEDSKDFDIEVFGLNVPFLSKILSPHFPSIKYCGESFGVFKVNEHIDVSVPRREEKI